MTSKQISLNKRSLIPITRWQTVGRWKAAAERPFPGCIYILLSGYRIENVQEGITACFRRWSDVRDGYLHGLDREKVFGKLGVLLC